MRPHAALCCRAHQQHPPCARRRFHAQELEGLGEAVSLNKLTDFRELHEGQEVHGGMSAGASRRHISICVYEPRWLRIRSVSQVKSSMCPDSATPHSCRPGRGVAHGTPGQLHQRSLAAPPAAFRLHKSSIMQHPKHICKTDLQEARGRWLMSPAASPVSLLPMSVHLDLC